MNFWDRLSDNVVPSVADDVKGTSRERDACKMKIADTSALPPPVEHTGLAWTHGGRGDIALRSSLNNLDVNPAVIGGAWMNCEPPPSWLAMISGSS